MCVCAEAWGRSLMDPGGEAVMRLGGSVLILNGAWKAPKQDGEGAGLGMKGGGGGSSGFGTCGGREGVTG